MFITKIELDDFNSRCYDREAVHINGNIIIKPFIFAFLSIGFAENVEAGEPHHMFGRLANPGFDGQPMKSVYFFAGQWRFFGPSFYDGVIPGVPILPASNAPCLYTVFPVMGGLHLGWSETKDKREPVLDLMIDAGVNVVNMSYWGPAGTDHWAFWAPMQTAPGAYDELFDAAVDKSILIVPYIENVPPTMDIQQTGCEREIGPIGRSATGFNFLDDFPGKVGDPAPNLVERIVHLVKRYIRAPANPAWPQKWAQMYDREGKPRYVVSLLHVGSNQTGANDETFAQAFTLVADRVYAETGISVGFTLDALPAVHNALFKPDPTTTGPLLARQAAILAIQPFIPEVYTGLCLVGQNCDAVDGSPNLDALLAWKRQYIHDWVSTGLPVILDVSPGYDAHRVFGNSVRYGNNRAWRLGQSEMLSLGVRGITGNAWNAYTEGAALVPSCGADRPEGPPGIVPCNERGSDPSDDAYRWFQSLALLTTE